VVFANAYGVFIKKSNPNKEKLTIVIVRDVRISRKMISSLVANTLVGLAINVADLGLSTSLNVEVAVPLENADGGIVLTASYSSKQWNAIKLGAERVELY
jgi:phosphomannomutase